MHGNRMDVLPKKKLLNIMSLSRKFSSCVKKVRKTVKTRKNSIPESAAIAICTKSVLFPRGRTIKRFKMIKGKPKLITQKRK